MSAKEKAQANNKNDHKQSAVAVRPVLSIRDRHRFVRFPHRLYADDPNYHAPLDLMIWERISPKLNPWFEHGEAQFYLAFRGDRVVGRISAQVDQAHLAEHDDGAGFFGFFDVEQDPEAASALLSTAADWCRARGMERIRGPFSLSINDESGMLVKGFDTSNYIMMPHGRQYFPEFVESAGFDKVIDLYAWRYSRDRIPEYAFEMAETARDHPGVEIRDLDMDHIERDVGIIMDIFNEAWSNNWGFVPLSEAELKKMAQEFKLIVDPELCMIAEVDGVPAAMTVALPNINEAFRDLDGKLMPAGWAKVLYRLKVKTPKTFRCVLLGIRKEHRGTAMGGLSVLLYTTIYQRAFEKGYVEAEASWTLETNKGINQGMELMGAEQYKTYRIYEKEL
jgi:GNAT superfamily N-acetyltransferase